MHGTSGSRSEAAYSSRGPLPAGPGRHVQEGRQRRAQPVVVRAAGGARDPTLPARGPVQDASATQ